MRLKRLKANGVHGYLVFDVEFREELTFLIGLNGAGKTTALRLLMGLLTPSFEALSQTDFVETSVEIETDGSTTEITARQRDDGIELSISGQSDPLFVTSAELQLIENPDRRSDSHVPVREKLQSNSVVQAIQELSTPMFLGLDRRMSGEEHMRGDGVEFRRRRLRSLEYEDKHRRFRGTVVAGLFDVLFLVEEAWRSMQARKDRLESKLRDDIVASAFSYSTSAALPSEAPDRKGIEAIKEKQAAIREATEGLKLPRIQESINDFYERMTGLIAQVEETLRRPLPAPGAEDEAATPADQAHMLEWFMNQTQVERMLGLIKLLEAYVESRAELSQRLDRFVSLVNGFLTQTGKEIAIGDRGRPEVVFQGTSRPLYALSSGERQIVVMLAHLALNRQLAESGIFIVDEPELSLHISWQEMFVRSVREANPTIQVILATHSPAIILDLSMHCVPVRAGEPSA